MSGAASISFSLAEMKGTIGNKEGASLQLFGLVTMVFFTHFLIVHCFYSYQIRSKARNIEI